ncbi:hypothetical protein [Okeania hirsuta]|uniref:hypothetical protein n=1 Tax=Okeania hirsuta TaxID=1458930 RepID=UPI000F529BB3|nr:hypothetical protein [Okeania hirsuta]RQH21145.1 hypothetical protein D4Z78_10115 [Okeania hirsuta]
MKVAIAKNSLSWKLNHLDFFIFTLNIIFCATKPMEMYNFQMQKAIANKSKSTMSDRLFPL